MTGKRTRYSADFKAKEALRGELTTAQLAAKHGIHQTMVGEWKRHGAGFFGESLRSMSLERRRQMIEPEHPQLSVARQCQLVSISRSGF
jgi:transposase